MIIYALQSSVYFRKNQFEIYDNLLYLFDTVSKLNGYIDKLLSKIQGNQMTDRDQKNWKIIHSGANFEALMGSIFQFEDSKTLLFCRRRPSDT